VQVNADVLERLLRADADVLAANATPEQKARITGTRLSRLKPGSHWGGSKEEVEFENQPRREERERLRDDLATGWNP
jgi:hypothetical protein